MHTQQLRQCSILRPWASWYLTLKCRFANNQGYRCCEAKNDSRTHVPPSARSRAVRNPLRRRMVVTLRCREFKMWWRSLQKQGKKVPNQNKDRNAQRSEETMRARPNNLSLTRFIVRQLGCHSNKAENLTELIFPSVEDWSDFSISCIQKLRRILVLVIYITNKKNKEQLCLNNDNRQTDHNLAFDKITDLGVRIVRFIQSRLFGEVGERGIYSEGVERRARYKKINRRAKGDKDIEERETER